MLTRVYRTLYLLATASESHPFSSSIYPNPWHGIHLPLIPSIRARFLEDLCNRLHASKLNHALMSCKQPPPRRYRPRTFHDVIQPLLSFLQRRGLTMHENLSCGRQPLAARAHIYATSFEDSPLSNQFDILHPLTFSPYRLSIHMTSNRSDYADSSSNGRSASPAPSLYSFSSNDGRLMVRAVASSSVCCQSLPT